MRHDQHSEIKVLREAVTPDQPIPQGLERYFPPCTLESCPRAGNEHRCVLPHQAELILAPEKYLAMVGGYGAAKTLAACVKGVLLTTQVRGNRGIVIRRTYSKLHDSTERIFLDVVKRLGLECDLREVRDGWPHMLIFPNGSEVVFRESKDLGRFLGPEYGWFFIDEAAEEPEKTFIDLQGRLRLPQAARYLCGFLATNPPHHTNWIPKMFGRAPGVSVRGKSQYRLWQVSSATNPYLPTSYLDDLRANNSAAEVRRIIDGQYGFSFEGKPVFSPPFDFGRHVVEQKPIAGLTVARVWDFGYRRPAVTWQQMGRTSGLCDKTHWIIVHEYIGAELESESLADIVLDQSKTVFPDHAAGQFIDGGDRAGAQHSEKGPGPIIRLAKKPWHLRFQHRNIPNIDPGLALVREALRDSCKCGRPVFLVHRECKETIDMLAGGYHYPGENRKLTGPPADKPQKDGFYDNLADTVRYGGELFYRRAIRDPEVLDRLMADQVARGGSTPSYSPAWMGELNQAQWREQRDREYNQATESYAQAVSRG